VQQQHCIVGLKRFKFDSETTLAGEPVGDFSHGRASVLERRKKKTEISFWFRQRPKPEHRFWNKTKTAFAPDNHFGYVGSSRRSRHVARLGDDACVMW
jgi:hypothetical protein